MLTLNKEEVPSDHPTIKMVEFDDHIFLTIFEIHSKETGRYEYTISNDSGEAQTTFWLNVTGLPDAPSGPLVVSDVDQRQATLAWKPPNSDGGSPVSHYVVEKRDTEREEWTVCASLVKEHKYIVSGLFEKHEYEFRVSAVNQNGQGPPLVGDKPIVARLPFGIGPSASIN